MSVDFVVKVMRIIDEGWQRSQHGFLCIDSRNITLLWFCSFEFFCTRRFPVKNALNDAKACPVDPKTEVLQFSKESLVLPRSNASERS